MSTLPQSIHDKLVTLHNRPDVKASWDKVVETLKNENPELHFEDITTPSLPDKVLKVSGALHNKQLNLRYYWSEHLHEFVAHGCDLFDI